MTDNNPILTNSIKSQYDALLQTLSDFYGNNAQKPDVKKAIEVKRLYEQLLADLKKYLGEDHVIVTFQPPYQRLVESKLWFQHPELAPHVDDSMYMPSVNRLMESQLWFTLLSGLQAGL